MSDWLVLDIGNTHTIAGLYPSPGSRDLRGFDLSQGTTVRFRTDANATSDEYRTTLTQLFAHGREVNWKRVERVIVSTVVPALEEVVKRACSPHPCLMIHSQVKREFDLDLPFPNQLGADRLANVAGALILAKGPFLIVDAGTATTFCLVDHRPAYIGGAITPGLEVSWKALQMRAAKLFSVELKRTESSVGTTTETQLQSGVLQGYEALIEGMADRLLRDAGPGFAERATLIATGGVMNWLQLSPRFRMEPDLTLLGLLRYGQLNS